MSSVWSLLRLRLDPVRATSILMPCCATVWHFVCVLLLVLRVGSGSVGVWIGWVPREFLRSWLDSMGSRTSVKIDVGLCSSGFGDFDDELRLYCTLMSSCLVLVSLCCRYVGWMSLVLKVLDNWSLTAIVELNAKLVCEAAVVRLGVRDWIWHWFRWIGFEDWFYGLCVCLNTASFFFWWDCLCVNRNWLLSEFLADWFVIAGL